MHPIVVVLALFAALCLVPAVHAADGDGPWPAAVAGFVPPQPGEHPRLLFRKADLPKLKARGQTIRLDGGKILVGK